MNYYRHLIGALLVLASIPLLAKETSQPTLSNNQIKQKIISESIDSYPGNCPCPYNAARNGSSCGKRSAWSRQGGYAPICYEREVTVEMINSWREQNKSASSSANTK